jgi:hypothetical protein
MNDKRAVNYNASVRRSKSIRAIRTESIMEKDADGHVNIIGYRVLVNMIKFPRGRKHFYVASENQAIKLARQDWRKYVTDIEKTNS